MSRKLVAYFSASGHTAKVAEHLAEAIGADLFEIPPRVRYTKKVLDWQDQASRSSVEMSDPSCRPEMEMLRDNMADYDTVYLASPYGGMSRRGLSIPFLMLMTCPARPSFPLQRPAEAVWAIRSSCLRPAARKPDS